MRYCDKCLNKLIKRMKKNTEPPKYRDFNPENQYYLDKTICDVCGQKLSEKMLDQWKLGENLYEIS